ncbi:hypothetical protein QCA50_018714 [Cerrena zonata]
MQMTDRETGERWMTTGTKPPEPVMCPPKVPVFPVVEVVVPVVRTAAGHDIQLDVNSDSMEDAPPSKAATSATGAKQTVSPLRPGRKRDQPSSSLESSSDEAATDVKNSRRQPKQQKRYQDVINLISTDEDDDDYVASSVPIKKEPKDHDDQSTSGDEDDKENEDDEDEDDNEDEDEVTATVDKGKGVQGKQPASTRTTSTSVTHSKKPSANRASKVKTKAKKKKTEGYYQSEKMALWDEKALKIPDGAWTEEQFTHEKRVGGMQEAIVACAHCVF